MIKISDTDLQIIKNAFIAYRKSFKRSTFTVTFSNNFKTKFILSKTTLLRSMGFDDGSVNTHIDLPEIKKELRKYDNIKQYNILKKSEIMYDIFGKTGIDDIDSMTLGAYYPGNVDYFEIILAPKMGDKYAILKVNLNTNYVDSIKVTDDIFSKLQGKKIVIPISLSRQRNDDIVFDIYSDEEEIEEKKDAAKQIAKASCAKYTDEMFLKDKSL